MSTFDDILDIAGVQGQEMIVLGGFNCNFSDKNDNIKECRRLKSIFKTHNLTRH